MDKKYCVIIDAYSSSRYLAAEFISRGFKCIHISSPGEKASYYHDTYRSEDFEMEITVKDYVNVIITQLSPLPIACVVAGSDPAVALADEIADKLGLKQNDFATSPLRRDKHLMAQCLGNHELAYIPDLESIDSEKIVTWAHQHQAWPIVIKPTFGAGTEGLSICQNQDEVASAIQRLLSHKSFLGFTFQEAIAQPFLTGQEYMINTVSCNGRHYISDIWQANKFRDENVIYDTSVLLPSQGEVQDRLAEYILKVVDVLGYKLGPAHNEVMLTSKGPVLIETNGRVMGLGIPNELQKQALGNTQISLTAEAFVDPESFAKHTSRPYQLKKNMVCVSHRVKKDHCVVNEAGLALIKQLPSFCFHKFLATGPVPKTIDLLTSPGWVLLMHEDMAVIEQDVQKIRDIEDNDVFI